jgi:hypothetical protein
MSTFTSGSTISGFHQVEQRYAVIQIHGGPYAAAFDGLQADGLGRRSHVSARKRFPQCFLDHGSKRPAGFGRVPLGLGEKVFIESHGGSNASKHA